MRAAWVLLLCLAGCPGLKGFDSAVFACDDDAQCLSGFVCAGARCVRPLEEGAACARDLECAAPLTCDRQQCRRPGTAGASCGDGGACAAGVCVDGVCCDRACTSACEQCSTGTCAPLERGARGRCQDFACNGQDAVCGGTCTPATVTFDCVGGHLCTSGRCVPCIGSLRDDFSALPASTWMERGSGTASTSPEGLSLTVTATGAGTQKVVSSTGAWPLEGCRFSFDVSAAGNVADGFFTALQVRGAADGLVLGFRLDRQGLKALCRYTNGAPCPTDGQVLRASPLAYPRLIVELQDHRVRWLGAAEGVTEVVLGEQADVIEQQNVLFELIAGTEGAVGSSTAVIRGVNLDRR